MTDLEKIIKLIIELNNSVMTRNDTSVGDLKHGWAQLIGLMKGLGLVSSNTERQSESGKKPLDNSVLNKYKSRYTK